MGVCTDVNKLGSQVGCKDWYLTNTSGVRSYNVSGRYYYGYGANYGYTMCYSPLRYWWDQSQLGRAYGALYCWSRIILGTCSDQETYDDYKIDTLSFSYAEDRNIQNNGTFTVSPDGSKITNMLYITGFNSSGSTKSINEIGIIQQSDFLIYRKRLLQPLVVPNNGYFRIRVSITVPVPEAIRPLLATGGDS